jgi:hypothetical protein
MMQAHAAYIDAFATALLADEPLADAPPQIARLVAQPGFAVYRNTVLKGCIDALEANYPTVLRLVGQEWLRAAASVFARAHLPSEPSLLVYGAGFPDFLASFEPARAVLYLADVARVDRWWTEAHVAADDPLLDAAVLASLTADDMRSMALRLHAATRWGWCDEWPIHTLWQRNRDDSDAIDDDIEWRGEGVLLTRPFGAVQVVPLTRGGVALLDAAAAGASIEHSVLAALEADPNADFAALIGQLLQAGALSSICDLGAPRTIEPKELR